MTLDRLARTHPRVLDAGIRLDRVPAAAWLGLQAAALLPVWVWMARRLRDGSDDPLGLLALAVLAVFAWTRRRELRPAPALGWLALATLGTLAATVLRTGAGVLPAFPPLAAGLVAVLALACGLVAFLPRRVAAAPVALLAVLALPLLASLQFYAGYPLRLLTAEASRWLLAPAFEVVRDGVNLWVDGRLVIVDAPCSGVQMAWLGYFAASVVALRTGRDSTSFVRRLPAVGLLVMAGNVVRNGVLVAFEGAGRALAPVWHDALGLLLLAAVCAGIARVMAPRPTAPTPPTAAGVPGSPMPKGERHAPVR